MDMQIKVLKSIQHLRHGAPRTIRCDNQWKSTGIKAFCAETGTELKEVVANEHEVNDLIEDANRKLWFFLRPPPLLRQGKNRWSYHCWVSLWEEHIHSVKERVRRRTSIRTTSTAASPLGRTTLSHTMLRTFPVPTWTKFFGHQFTRTNELQF